TITFFERDASMRACAGNPSCFAASVREHAPNVDLILLASVRRIQGGFIVGLRLIDVGSGMDLGIGGGRLEQGASIAGALESEIPKLFPRAEFGPLPSLAIESDPSGADASIEGKRCRSPCTLSELSPGAHKVEVLK